MTTDANPKRPGFGEFTAEQRAEFLEKARAGKIAQRLAGAHLRREFLATPEWDELARAHKVRLPEWTVQVTPANIRKWLKKVGMSMSEYYDWMGYPRQIGLFHELNPDWPMRALAGLLLERVDSFSG